MRWAFSEDNTPAVITAEKHVRSSHGSGDIRELPETCVIFELGIALRFLKENFDTVTLYDRLPCFLDNPECIAVKGIRTSALPKADMAARRLLIHWKRSGRLA